MLNSNVSSKDYVKGYTVLFHNCGQAHHPPDGVPQGDTLASIYCRQ